jgi:hypothetical protein
MPSGRGRLVLSEHDEQVAVVEYCAMKSIPVYAIPNGGLRRKSEAARLKAEGVSKGAPDLCIPMARGRYHSLYIEMKAEGGKPTAEQSEWLVRLRAEGMCAYCCIGAASAIELIDQYMALEPE